MLFVLTITWELKRNSLINSARIVVPRRFTNTGKSSRTSSDPNDVVLRIIYGTFKLLIFSENALALREVYYFGEYTNRKLGTAKNTSQSYQVAR